MRKIAVPTGRPLKKAFAAALGSLILIFNSATPAAAGIYEDAFATYSGGDYATALRLFRSLAEKGDPRAQSSLGVMYAKGDGVPQNYAEALKWLRLGAEATPEASLCSGSCTPRARASHRTM